jgi:hypothetical protein
MILRMLAGLLAGTFLFAASQTAVTVDLAALAGRTLAWDSTVVEVRLRNCEAVPPVALKAYPDTSGKVSFKVPSLDGYACGTGYYELTVRERGTVVLVQGSYVYGSAWDWNAHRAARTVVDPPKPALEDDGQTLKVNRSLRKAI